MRIQNLVLGTLAVVACGGFLTPRSATAQLANASATTLGLAGNATASARGLAAISVNPAGLGMPGSGFTLALIPVQIRSGLDPITLKDVKDFEGTLIPAATKEEWLSRVAAEGSESGAVGLDLSAIGLAIGRFGFQVSTIGAANMSLSPDILEVILYGNAGRTGSPIDVSFTGSSLDAFAVSTAGLSAAFPLASSEGSMAVGATLKYSVRHAVTVGRDRGGSVQADPIQVTVDFPMIRIGEEYPEPNNGSGIGVDLGFQMKRGKVGFGAAVQNAVSTFEWDDTKLVYVPGTVHANEDSTSTDFDEHPLSGAPASLMQLVEDMRFDPIVSVGGSYDVNDDFTVSVDLRNRFGDGLALAPKLHAGVGAEFRGLRVLHLRGGAAIVTDGIELGGGASLVLGPVSFTAAGGVRCGDLDDTTLGQFTFSFGGR